ncbi:MAG TPA: DUF2490 domain-containing protein [Bacteroidetes bacterium]|nr:DUF2490 domain-containing protein [Bacteroidota bacterium]
MNFYKLTLLNLLGMLPLLGFAQPSVSFGVLPKFSLSYKLPKGFKVAHSLENRQFFYTKIHGTQGVFEHSNVLTDFATTLTKATGARSGIGIGYTLRVRDGELYHRIAQQFYWTKKYETFRLSNRIALDQTFGPENSIQLRAHYRASVELPLSGSRIDPNEFYLKLSNEYLGITNNKGSNDLEIRFAPLLGYKLSLKSKFEFGFDSRISKLFEENSSLSTWVDIGFFTSL